MYDGVPQKTRNFLFGGRNVEKPKSISLTWPSGNPSISVGESFDTNLKNNI